jgi:hypothetical protein
MLRRSHQEESSGDVIGPATLMIMDLVNPRLQEHCHRRLSLDKKSDFAGHITPKHLLGDDVPNSVES